MPSTSDPSRAQSSTPPAATMSPPATPQPTPSWAQNIFASIRGFFTVDNGTAQSEADAVEGWMGVRKGRGRCRSVGEAH
ncbi:hypothetical protein N7462_003839 [Penicillium macrosclerotiorum]|uniref:uncharacterized protein n=1 Tax=Penicillium macrosclerotiorum TaxID=303699 RepID=UPI0025468A2A|nr:uncharacterized protein N7462_003839 [Penicillium macrosclerotiorum]KAJ5689447.1 hypothetical protein N7462_003839 [Penicillium macrosclerotiorum]